MPRRAAVPDNQPSLFDEFAPPPPPPPPPPLAKPKPRTNRRHRLGLRRPWANAHGEHTCLVCGHDEEDGTCLDGCAIVCGRPIPLDRKDRKAPVEVCLITTTVTARIAQGAPAYQLPGRRLAVATCPRCGRVNWHRPAPGRAYRIGQCGHPYITSERSS